MHTDVLFTVWEYILNTTTGEILMEEEVRTGSTRMMRAVESGVISLTYTDVWSVFDRGPSPQIIPGIGAARCACAVRSFDIVELAGLPVHYIEQVSPVTIHVSEFRVPGHASLSGKTCGRVLDAEWIWRQYVYGSLLDRINTGTVRPTSLGFARGEKIVEGTKLPRLLKECTTKFEVIDRHLSDTDARIRIGLSEFQWHKAWERITQAVLAIEAVYNTAGFYRPDGKLELGLSDGADGGELVIVDVLGTPDEDRILDKKKGFLHCKDLIRNHLKAMPWKAELDRAKAEFPDDKSKWPPYPMLPNALVELVAERYAEVARRYTSVPIV